MGRRPTKTQQARARTAKREKKALPSAAKRFVKSNKRRR